MDLSGVALIVAAVAVFAVAGWVVVRQVDPAASGPSLLQPRETFDRDVILFLGDSYFNGTDYTALTDSMAYLAGQKLGYVPLVAGAGGTGFTARNPASGDPAYGEQIAAGAIDLGERPDLVVVEGGLNDRGADPAAVTDAAVDVLAAVRRTHRGVPVVLVGPVDTDGDMSDTTPIAGALGRAADKAGVPFLDARRWLGGKYGLIGADGVHPTPEGQVLLGRALAAAIEPHLPE